MQGKLHNAELPHLYSSPLEHSDRELEFHSSMRVFIFCVDRSLGTGRSSSQEFYLMSDL